MKSPTEQAKASISEFNTWQREFIAELPPEVRSDIITFLNRHGGLDFVTPLLSTIERTVEEGTAFDPKIALQKVSDAATEYLRSDFSESGDLLLQLEIQRRKRLYVDYCLGYLAGFLRERLEKTL